MKTLLTFILVSLITFNINAQKKLPNINIKSLQGKTIASQSLIEEEMPVVISFWATWCKPCLIEMEAVSENYEDWQEEKSFKFIAISTDDSRSSSRVKSLVAGKGWPFDIYLDTNQEFKRALNINNVPFLIVINSKGEIIYEHSGFTSGDEFELFDFLKTL
jgi:thiol-disulfide isomerase/thioredoxin